MTKQKVGNYNRNKCEWKGQINKWELNVKIQKCKNVNHQIIIKQSLNEHRSRHSGEQKVPSATEEAAEE